MANQGYYQSPSVFQDLIVFGADDDIWSVQNDQPLARRLTTGPGRNSSPKISRNGKFIAYNGEKNSRLDVYLIDAQGGQEKRITHFGAILSSWLDDDHILAYSAYDEFSFREFALYKINIHTLDFEKLPIGPARSLSIHHAGKKQLLGRNIGDPARWKRYRGGTAGHLWIDKTGRGQFERFLKNLKSNISSAMWVHDHVYFISDHEGVGNIYRCKDTGRNIERITNHLEFYVRSFDHDQNTIVYACGGDVYQINLADMSENKIEIDFRTNANQRKARFFDCEDHLQYFAATESAEEVSVISRGKLINLEPFKGAPLQIGTDHARYKIVKYINDGDNQHLAAVKIDEEFFEKIVVFDEENNEKEIVNEDLGKYLAILPATDSSRFAFTTGRNCLYWYDLKKKNYELIHENPDLYHQHIDWSPCGRFLAYNTLSKDRKLTIFIYDTETKEHRELISAVSSDTRPVFSKCGNYLFFSGVREFNPVLSETNYDWSYPIAYKIYAVALNSDADHILELPNNISDSSDDDDDSDEKETKNKKSSKETKDKDKKKKVTKIEYENINHRILPLPIEMGGLIALSTIEGKLFYMKPSSHLQSDYDRDLDIWCYEIKSGENKKFASNVYDYELTSDGKYLIYYGDDGLRLVPSDSKPSDGAGLNKKDGWIDLERIQLKVYPSFEWKQMYDEAWLLQKENFWNENMSNIEWEDIYFRYLPLLGRICTRAEFSDLMWEMQGELGTSHCYEAGGEYYRRSSKYLTGYLGAKLQFHNKDGHYIIEHIYEGDSWIPGSDSPLLAPNVELKTGDKIIELNGISFENQGDLYELLEGKAGLKVELTVLRKGDKEEDYVEVTPVNHHNSILYREWVNKNRKYVSEKSNGKLGYIHIPDMHLSGHQEFFRHYFTESQKEGLIVDVRYNGGGNLSGHFLRYLSQKVIGFDQTRWMGHWNYPGDSVNGPIVAITNEHAGSDGDIFSHSFKLMKIGKLIGMRTWGGVVGIWPRHLLNDGTWTSQPEFSHWFKDVGWAVENYGTDPDIEIEIRPQDYAKGIDTQLDRAIKEAMAEARKNPPLKKPNARTIPSLSLPKRLK